MVKGYYMPSGNAYFIGFFFLLSWGIIILMGLYAWSFDFGVFFQEIVSGVGSLFGIVGILFWLIIGFLHVYNAKKILRIKIDEKGVYFKGEGLPRNKLLHIFYLNQFIFVPFDKMHRVEHVKKKWIENVLVHLKDETVYGMDFSFLGYALMPEVTDILNQALQQYKLNKKIDLEPILRPYEETEKTINKIEKSAVRDFLIYKLPWIISGIILIWFLYFIFFS